LIRTIFAGPAPDRRSVRSKRLGIDQSPGKLAAPEPQPWRTAREPAPEPFVTNYRRQGRLRGRALSARDLARAVSPVRSAG
jgi:hypothetical protein